MDSHRALWAGFLRSAERFPERPALVAADQALAYKDLREAACRIAATLQAQAESSDSRQTAVFAHRSPAAFAGVLGAPLTSNEGVRRRTHRQSAERHQRTCEARKDLSFEAGQAQNDSMNEPPSVPVSIRITEGLSGTVGMRCEV